MKKEPNISAENQPLEKPVIIKKEPAELQAKQSMDNTSSNGRGSQNRVGVCVVVAPGIFLHWSCFRSVFSAVPRGHRGAPVRSAVAKTVPLTSFEAFICNFP